MEAGGETETSHALGSSARHSAVPFERRVTLDLTREDHRALKTAAVEADTSMAGLLRALVGLWRDDPQLAERVHERCSGSVPTDLQR